MHILLVEDDQDTALSIRDAVKHRYTVDAVDTGERGIFEAEVNDYDLIILDLNLPDINGIKVCKRLRHDGIKTPILFLTGSSDITNRVKGLDAGADDYLVKPFHTDELNARLRALTRRANKSFIPNKIKAGDLLVDTSSARAYHHGKLLDLRRKEYLLLEYLVRNAGKIVTRNMFIEHVWDNHTDPGTNTVDVHIKFLRDKVDKPFGTNLIRTIHGVGYSLDVE